VPAKGGQVLKHIFQKEKRGVLKCKMDSVLRSNFAGGMVRKTETNFLKFCGIQITAPQEGAGEMRGGGF